MFTELHFRDNKVKKKSLLIINHHRKMYPLFSGEEHNCMKNCISQVEKLRREFGEIKEEIEASRCLMDSVRDGGETVVK